MPQKLKKQYVRHWFIKCLKDQNWQTFPQYLVAVLLNWIPWIRQFGYPFVSLSQQFAQILANSSSQSWCNEPGLLAANKFSTGLRVDFCDLLFLRQFVTTLAVYLGSLSIWNTLLPRLMSLDVSFFLLLPPILWSGLVRLTTKQPHNTMLPTPILWG